MTTWPTLKSPDWSAGDVLTAANLNTVLDAHQHLESAWTLETALLGASTTAPSSLAVDTCYYKSIGKTLWVRYYYQWGAGTNDGSGTYRLILPNSLSCAGAGTQVLRGFVKLVGALQAGFIASATASDTYFVINGLDDTDGMTNNDSICYQGIVEVS